jgi:Domain of unknown function (DUF7014)
VVKPYSKRNQPPSVGYRYDIPLVVRKRILYALGQLSDYTGARYMMLGEVEQRILIGFGELVEAISQTTQADEPVIEHYLSCSDDQCLDFLEFLFQTHCHCEEQAGVDVINEIFRDAGIGYELSPFVTTETTEKIDSDANSPFSSAVRYEYTFPIATRKTSEILHAEVVTPAQQLLTDARFKGANEEYLSAHEYFRKSDNGACLNECLKAFESTMKIICHSKGWQYNQNDTASRLIAACLDNGLFPSYQQQQLTSLRGLLETSIPTPRNKQSGHGQGVQRNAVDDGLAGFVLHCTGATILLLVNAAAL